MEEQASQIERQFGKYRLIAELGRGGMANVYLAVVQGPAGFNKLMVVKFLKAELASDPSFVEMFLAEARLAARLNHPNVVQTNEVGSEGGRPYIAMEFLDGQPMNRVQNRGARSGSEPLPQEMHLRILCEMLAGLHHAHELQDYDGTPLGVVHRDVTPHNLFVTYDGQVKVVDFGIAKVLNSTNHTQTGVLKGKVAYMSPEQVKGEPLDRRADLFTTGILLWEAIAGQRMWKGLSDVVILKRMVLGELPPLHEVKPETSPELLRIVDKALALNPDQRYSTALELRSDLEAYLRSQGSNPSGADIGAWLKTNFADDRAKLRGIIEAQLSKARTLTTGDYAVASLPVLDLTSTLATSGFPGGSGSGTPSSIRIATSSAQGPSSVSGLAPAPTSSVSVAPPPPKSALPRVVMALGAAAAVAVGGFFLTRSPATPAEVPAATAAPPPATAEVREVEVRIVANPPEAQLLWDDKPLPGNPFKGRFALDGKPHRLVVKATGFVSRSQEIDLGTASEVTINLEREADAGKEPPKDKDKDKDKDDKPSSRPSGGGRYVARTPDPTPTAAPTPQPTAPPADTSSLKVDPGKKPKRSIDKDVPYPLDAAPKPWCSCPRLCHFSGMPRAAR